MRVGFAAAVDCLLKGDDLTMRLHPTDLPPESCDCDVHLVGATGTHLVINESSRPPQPGQEKVCCPKQGFGCHSSSNHGRPRCRAKTSTVARAEDGMLFEPFVD